MPRKNWKRDTAVGAKPRAAVRAKGLSSKEVYDGICGRHYYEGVVRGAVHLSDRIRGLFAERLGISPDDLTVQE